MGAGWLITCEKTGPHELPHKGKALLFAQFQLEEIARDLEMPPLKDFFSSNPGAISGYFRDQGLNPDDYDLPEEVWYEPADAMPTIQALLKQLEDDPGMIQGLEKVREDLEAIQSNLAEADIAGERFHIATAMPDLSGREPERLR